MILSYMVNLQLTLGESARLFSTVVTHLPTVPPQPGWYQVRSVSLCF